MRAIILAGGYGSRLAPLTLRMPKALVPVGGETVLGHLLRLTAQAGVSHVVLSLNKNQKAIEEAFGSHACGLPLEYHYEHSESDLDKPGAIGALRQLAEELGAEESLLLGGDNTVYGLDLKKMKAFHHAKKSLATLALYELSNPALVELYGVAKLDSGGRINAFQEKPKVAMAVSHLVSTAIYLLSSEFLQEPLQEYVALKKGKTDRIGDLWHYFVDKLPLYGFPFTGIWGDTNSTESYIEIHKQIMCLQPRLTDIHPSVMIAPSAKICPPVIVRENCHIEENAVVGPCTVLEKNCHIEKKAVVESSVLFEGACVAQQARVLDSVIDRNARVGLQTLVESYALIGEGAQVGKNVRVARSSRIWPHVQIQDQNQVDGTIL